MRASDFERRGRFFQVQTIIDYRFGIADTPPTGNRETLDIEKAWRDVQAADTVAGLGPFVSAETKAGCNLEIHPQDTTRLRNAGGFRRSGSSRVTYCM